MNARTERDAHAEMADSAQAKRQEYERAIAAAATFTGMSERDLRDRMPVDRYQPHTPVWFDEAEADDTSEPERMLTGVILAAVFAVGACAGWLAFALTHGLALTG